MSQLKHRRCAQLCLIFGIVLTIATTKTLAATETTTTKVAAGIVNNAANAVTPTGVFTNVEQPLYDAPAAAVVSGGSAPSTIANSQYYPDEDSYVPYRSDTHDEFSWTLIKQILHEEKQSNVIVSPFSVKLVLSMLLEAAGNNTQTQKELVRTLTDLKSPDNIRGFYKKTLPGLKKPNPNYTLNLATRLFADEFIQPEQRYAAILETSYDTGIQRLNFANAPAAAKVINDWCSNVTQNKLQQLVQEDNIQSNVLLMVNAIYFKGLWRTQFNESFPGVFFRTPAQQLRVNYMEQTDYFYYYNSQSLDARILRLPYKGKKFSMFILLPNSKGGVEQLTQDLENDQLKRMQWMMDETKVKLTMPKFKFDFDKNVKETLMQLGITEIFTDSASLPGLARGADVAGKLRVSNIFQKAGIEVNEKGTEAYAATVVEIENKFGGSSMVQEFNVNRPFIFFIEEEGTGNIIFAGKVHEPIA